MKNKTGRCLCQSSRERKGFSNNKGITIIELMVVVVVVGILATLAITRYNTFVIKSKISEAVIMVRHLQSLADAYYANQGAYPNQDGTYLYVADKDPGDAVFSGSTWWDNFSARTGNRLREMGVERASGETRFWYVFSWWGWSSAATRIIYAYPKDVRDWPGFTAEECDGSLKDVTVAVDNDGQVYIWGVPGLSQWF